jgi:hypothetical protein
MSFQITVTEKEILETPNYFELGKLINNKYWQAKRDLEGPQFDDEHVGLTINEDGLVTSINRSDDYDTCVVCGKKLHTSKVQILILDTDMLKELVKLVLTLIIVTN